MDDLNAAYNSTSGSEPTPERRAGVDRRVGTHDELFKYAVMAGFFVDMRKNNRRK
jgi:hypothetical protein